ncbi:hypothetical protein D9615_006212 [Tricholomella constricta]|uniref:Uncharacterized protein n=1 Tax=Tricholomella constricta TaxID=117010 RepID=A0A8H5HBM0_9AGAR|nr:hypothetical protein D9615_006212 [Tricholomella constricta]
MSNPTEQGDSDNVAIRIQVYDPALSVGLLRPANSAMAIKNLLVFTANAHLRKQVNGPLNLEPGITIIDDPKLPVVLDPSFPPETKYCDLPPNVRALTVFLPANMHISARRKENVDPNSKTETGGGGLPSTSKPQAAPAEAPSASAGIDPAILLMFKDLKDEVSGLKATNLEMAKESKRQRATIDTLKTANGEMQAKNKKMEANIGTLEKANDDKTKAIDSLKTANGEMKAKTKKLEANIGTLGTANDKFAVKAQKLEANVDTLTKANEDLQAQSHRQELSLREECAQLRQRIVQLERVAAPIRKRYLLDEARKKLLGLVPAANSWLLLQEQYPTSTQLLGQLHLGDITPLTTTDIDYLYDPYSKIRLEGNKAAHQAFRKDVLCVIQQETNDSTRMLLRRFYLFVYGKMDLELEED